VRPILVISTNTHVTLLRLKGQLQGITIITKQENWQCLEQLGASQKSIEHFPNGKYRIIMNYYTFRLLSLGKPILIG